MERKFYFLFSLIVLSVITLFIIIFSYPILSLQSQSFLTCIFTIYFYSIPFLLVLIYYIDYYMDQSPKADKHFFWYPVFYIAFLSINLVNIFVFESSESLFMVLNLAFMSAVVLKIVFKGLDKLKIVSKYGLIFIILGAIGVYKFNLDYFNVIFLAYALTYVLSFVCKEGFGDSPKCFFVRNINRLLDILMTFLTCTLFLYFMFVLKMDVFFLGIKLKYILLGFFSVSFVLLTLSKAYDSFKRSKKKVRKSVKRRTKKKKK